MRPLRIWMIAALRMTACLAMTYALAGGLSCCTTDDPPSNEPADLLLVGGVIHTMDRLDTVAEAIAVTDGAIIYVGDAAGAEVHRADHTEVIDLLGATVLPGFIDSHSMPFRLGDRLQTIELEDTRSIEEVRQRLTTACAAAEPGEWVYGQGWDQARWNPPVFPTAADLDVCPANPVVLLRIGAHCYWVNDVALQRAGISRATPDIEGGRIIRDGDGHPTGMLADNARRLIDSVMPQPTADEQRERLLLGQGHSLERGVVGVVAGGVAQGQLTLLEDLAREGKLVQRFYTMLQDDGGLIADSLARGPRDGEYDDHLTVRCIKLYADGSLGSRGAALEQDYADDPGNRGVLTSTPEHIEKVTLKALKAGFQVGTHAIGDRALHMVLDAYDRALHQQPNKDPRLRIEHTQIAFLADAVRMRELDVIAVITPTAATTDMGWAPGRLGPSRMVAAYPWRTLVEIAEHVAMGLDASVETSNPLWAIYAAVTREDHEGQPSGGWQPDQRLTMRQAIRGFTIDAAYGTFSEGRRGSLESGKHADMVVLPADPFTIDPQQLLTMSVLLTIAGGQVVYDGRVEPAAQVEPGPSGEAPPASSDHVAGT